MLDGLFLQHSVFLIRYSLFFEMFILFKIQNPTLISTSSMTVIFFQISNFKFSYQFIQNPTSKIQHLTYPISSIFFCKANISSLKRAASIKSISLAAFCMRFCVSPIIFSNFGLLKYSKIGSAAKFNSVGST